jgi:hypothetical protein
MIPEQLKGCKFCKIGLWNLWQNKDTDEKKFFDGSSCAQLTQEKIWKPKGKTPFEKGWQQTFYSYGEIVEWRNYNKENNYGVLTGIDGLGVLDDDSPDKVLMNLFETAFGKSFRVRDHYYIKLLGWNGEKIIFFDSGGRHLGELQGKGQQVIGPGSRHPSGAIYDVRENITIKEIPYEEFEEVFKCYLPVRKSIPEVLNAKGNWTGEDVKDIPLSSIISFSELMDVGDGYQGSHPVHGSAGGMNFRVNPHKNVWHCFRCGSGGGPAELIAVVEGIIDCSDAGRGCLQGSKGSEVIKVAREKYGLKEPVYEEPTGWARSINVKKMAERKGILKCPFCNSDFKFNELMGWYNCNCSKGGIRDFIKNFIIKNEPENKKTDQSI